MLHFNAASRSSHNALIRVARFPLSRLPHSRLPRSKLPQAKLPYAKLPYTKLPHAKLPQSRLSRLKQSTYHLNEHSGHVWLNTHSTLINSGFKYFPFSAGNDNRHQTGSQLPSDQPASDPFASTQFSSTQFAGTQLISSPPMPEYTLPQCLSKHFLAAITQLSKTIKATTKRWLTRQKKAALTMSAAGLLFLSPLAMSQTQQQQCLLDAINSASDETSVADIKQQCINMLASNEAKQPEQPPHDDTKTSAAIDDTDKAVPTDALSQRLAQERTEEDNPYFITPHKMNYILPISHTDNFNEEVYNGETDWVENFNDSEIKFQLSLKVPLNLDDLFIENDALYIGFTLKSFWQAYASDISAPFRETNYEPEIFYFAPNQLSVGGGNVDFYGGFVHQSNGRSQLLSRSWNRAYVGAAWSNEDMVIALRPWYRFAEDADEDDNPDIEDYMGHFDLSAGYKWKQLEFTALGRNNFSTNKGAIELGTTFPLWGRLRGFVQYFNGYGDSLIDYNISQERIGIGFALTDML